MAFKRFRRFACVLAGACALATAFTFAGCTSDHPEAKVTIKFNDVSYVLEYKLYRSYYPQTVQHFIELADAKFYDNTIIHNYSAGSYWYGGGYSYNAQVDGEATDYVSDFNDKAMEDYLYNNSKEKAYYNLAGKLTPSVYRDYIDGKYVGALSTLIGEFGSQHTFKYGDGLKSSYGCLRMYYSEKDTDAVVHLRKTGSVGKDLLDGYEANSATSLFTIQVSSSTSADSDNAIFAVLQNTDKLKELQTAITDYINDNALTTTTFTSTYNDIQVDLLDEIIGETGNQVSYTLTKEPIIVESVRITKY